MRAVLYSAPFRLIGHRLKVRFYSDRLKCYLAAALVLTLPRGARSGACWIIDFRHFIDALKREPKAFKGLVFRDALLPQEAYRSKWKAFECKLSQRSACRTMVGLLELACMDGIEAVLAERFYAVYTVNQLPDLKLLRVEFAPRDQLCPTVRVDMPPASTYDALLDEQVFA